MKTKAALLFAVSLAACDVPQEQEAAMGAEAAEQIGSQLPLVRDPYINAYINELGDTIAKRTSRADLDWQFAVVNSHQINAFALPGGFIYVNRGLIEATSTVDELAGVLGHEIGHVVQRHSVEQMQNRQKVGAVAQLTCILTNICESGLGQAAIQIGGTAIISRYSRGGGFGSCRECAAGRDRSRGDPIAVRGSDEHPRANARGRGRMVLDASARGVADRQCEAIDRAGRCGGSRRVTAAAAELRRVQTASLDASGTGYVALKLLFAACDRRQGYRYDNHQSLRRAFTPAYQRQTGYNNKVPAIHAR